MSIFEAIMLICFGASWPAAVYKTYKTKNVEGKSLLFLSLILIGYIAGMTHKVLNSFDFVFWLYVANFALVMCDFILYFKYKQPALRPADDEVVEQAA